MTGDAHAPWVKKATAIDHDDLRQLPLLLGLIQNGLEEWQLTKGEIAHDIRESRWQCDVRIPEFLAARPSDATIRRHTHVPSIRHINTAYRLRLTFQRAKSNFAAEPDLQGLKLQKR